MSDLLQPSLRRYPDARMAPFPLLDPLLFPYFGLLFGTPLVALIACINAVAVRRVVLFFVCLLLGFAAWVGFLAAATNNFFFGRVANFVAGCLFYFVQRHYIRGHVFLGGRVTPLPATYLIAFVVALFLPDNIAALLMGVPIGR